MTQLAVAALSGIAPLMRALAQDPRATCNYDVMSGALVWSDEFPAFRDLARIKGWSIIRVVLRFRTELILGKPDEQFREFWDTAMRLFPEWPGFAPERQSPELREIYRENSATSDAELDEIEREMNREAGEQTIGG